MEFRFATCVRIFANNSRKNRSAPKACNLYAATLQSHTTYVMQSLKN